MIAIVGGRRVFAPIRPSWIAWLLAAWCVAEAGQHVFGAKVYYQLGAAAGSRGRFRELIWRTPLAMGYLALSAGLLSERSRGRAACRFFATASAAVGAISYFAPESLEPTFDAARLAHSPRFVVIVAAVLAWRLKFAGEKPTRFDGTFGWRNWLRVPVAGSTPVAAAAQLQFERRNDRWRVRRAALLGGGRAAIDTAVFDYDEAVAASEWVGFRTAAKNPADPPQRCAPDDGRADVIAMRIGDAANAAVFRVDAGQADGGWLIEFECSRGGARAAAGTESQ